jgi:WD40 repeat protein
MSFFYKYLLKREYSSIINTDLQEEFYTKYFETYKQKKINTKNKFNKVFSSKWIDKDTILFGTKDLKIYIYKKNKISLIDDFNIRDNTHGIKSTSFNKNNKIIAISLNNKILLYDCNNYPKYMFEFLHNHEDWISNISWISDNQLLSSSKDGTIRLWDINNRNNFINIIKQETIYPRYFVENNNKLNTLSYNGIINEYDLETNKLTNTFKNNKEECVVMKLNKEKNILAIGECDVISFYDNRSHKYIMSIPTFNETYGVRSLEWIDGNILSIGGGNGRLSFFDNRKDNGFIKKHDKNFYSVNSGWMKKDETYNFLNEVSHNDDYKNISIFTHKFNHLNKKIFVGGGPTCSGVTGSFIEIFE